MRPGWQNLRYSLRALRKNPGFTTVAILSLALGIGANTAIFTLINALLLRDLPVPHPERLVELSLVREGHKIPFSYPMFRELDRGQRVFSSLMAWSGPWLQNVEANGILAQSRLYSVTGNYFSQFGATPLFGRLLTEEDSNPRRGSTIEVAVIGYEFWQERLGGAHDVIGKQIRLEGQPFTIIGVTRKWFTGMTPGELPELTVPITAVPVINANLGSLDNRSSLWVRMTGRLRDGVTIDQARAQLKSFWAEVLLATASTQTPGLRRQTFLSMGLEVSAVRTGVADMLRTQFSRPLYVLSGIVALILLVACVNLANLMLARAAARSREMSVRVAIGAGRAALARQVLTESLVLSVSGALLGLVLSYWGSRLLVAFMTEGTVSLDLRPDWRVLSIALFVGVFTGILFGLAPTWHCSRQDPALALQQGTRSLAGGAGKLGKALIITQVGLSLVLLLGAGLLVGTFQKLRSLDLGFEKDNLLEVMLNAKPGGYQNLDMNSYHKQVIERVSKVPGVRSVGLAEISIPSPPAGQEQQKVSATSEDPNTGFHVMAEEVTVWPGFFNALGIRLASGRYFELTDDEKHPHLAIVSKSLAERLFPNGEAIGQHVRYGFWPEFQNLEIVGVAGDARILDLRDPAPPIIYLSYLQAPPWAQWGELYVRAKEKPEALAKTIGYEIDALGHEYLFRSATVDQMVSRVLVNERVIALLSSFFAALALLLASIGLYGLMSYGVTRRTREIGVRVALGAQPGTVRWMILRETLTLTLFGIALGVPSGLAASRLIASMLFGLSPSDLSTFVTACLLLAAVAFLAGYLPARRASSIDPMLALRTE
jgi:predicted permease